MSDPVWLKPNEAAAYLRISRRSFDRLNLPRYEPSKRAPRFLKSDLDAYMEGCRVVPRPAAPLEMHADAHLATRVRPSQKPAPNWLKENLRRLHPSRTATASSKSDGAK